MKMNQGSGKLLSHDKPLENHPGAHLENVFSGCMVRRVLNFKEFKILKFFYTFEI